MMNSKRRATDFANQTEGFHLSIIEAVNSIYAGDHGTLKHRFGAKTVFRFKDKKNRKKKSVV